MLRKWKPMGVMLVLALVVALFLTSPRLMIAPIEAAAAEVQERLLQPKESKRDELRFPKHWGEEPKIQTKDLRELPAGYGRGSSTLARWITEHLDIDNAQKQEKKKPKEPKDKPKDKVDKETKKILSKPPTALQLPYNCTPTLVSLSKPARADVRGNLADAQSVTNESVADWLKDRWQAATNMRGTPIPGPHWIEIDLQKEYPVEALSKIVIDWEDAYSDYWTLQVRGGGSDDWVNLCKGKGSKSKGGKGKAPGPEREKEGPISFYNDVKIYTSKRKQHVTHKVILGPIDMGAIATASTPRISLVRLLIHRGSTLWGSSVWRFQVWAKDCTG